MRWDDLQILKLIDECEEKETGALSSGFNLMERARDGRQLDYQRDPQTFAHELLVARDGGLLTFDETGHMGRLADPRYDAHQWLQQIRDLRLTAGGRDRARGRLIESPLPDPEEDDGRMITGYVLELIARSIGDTYTMNQLPRFLIDSGIPADRVPAPQSENKWEYVAAALEGLMVGSAARRVLRNFIGAWLSGHLHAPPGDRDRKQIVALLAQQGWHVKDGRLVIGERIAAAPGTLTPLDRDGRIATLHATIRQVVERYLESGHMEVAIFEAFKSVNNRVKEMTGLDSDGSDLMAKAFGDDKDPHPPIRMADLTQPSGRNIQSGFKFIFMGAVRGIRNPDAHELFEPISDAEGFEELSLASMLMRRLDEAQVSRRATQP